MKKLAFVLIMLMSLPAFANDFLAKSDYKSAYIEFNDALEKEKSPLNYLNMCRVTFYLNDDKTAKHYCNTALNMLDKEKRPDMELKSDVLSMLGNIYANEYHNTSITFDFYNQSKEIKENAQNTDKYELAKLYLNMAYAYYGIGEYFLTKDSLEKTLKISNAEQDSRFRLISAAVYNVLGLIEKDYGKLYFEKGIKELEAANECKSPKLEGMLNYNLAQFYEEVSKDKNRAERYYNIAEAAVNSAIIINLSEKWFLDGNKSTSFDKKEVEKILKDYPYAADGLYLMAKYYLFKEMDDEAEVYIEKLITTYKESAVPYALAADVYSSAYASAENKNFVYRQKANEYLKQFMDKFKYDSIRYYIAGCISMDLANGNAAEKYFKKYVQSPPYTDLKCKKVADIYESYGNNEYLTKKKEEYLNLAKNRKN